jgi:hypothetical protein
MVITTSCVKFGFQARPISVIRPQDFREHYLANRFSATVMRNLSVSRDMRAPAVPNPMMRAVFVLPTMTRTFENATLSAGRAIHESNRDSPRNFGVRAVQHGVLRNVSPRTGQRLREPRVAAPLVEREGVAVLPWKDL